MKNDNNRYREEEKEETAEGVESEIVDEIPDGNVEELKAEVNKYHELYLRTLAETENFKKRLNDERAKERKYACYSLVEKMINALDIFDKVVSVKPEDEKLRNYLIGFEMINNQLKQIVEDEGLKPIKAIGEKFNPSYHHAVETVCDENYEDDVIVEEMQRGYMFKDRILRPALVKVNRKQKENIKEEN